MSDFTVNVGDEFEIKKRYDKHGWPRIRVLEVRETSLLVQDRFRDGSTTHPDGHTQKPRVLHDDAGWPKLQKYWKRRRK